MNWKFTFNQDQVDTLLAILDHVHRDMNNGSASQTTSGLALTIARVKIENIMEDIKAVTS